MEEWRIVDGYENYEVSSHGRIRNIDTNKLLKIGIPGGQGGQVKLSKNGKAKGFTISRLVGLAFIPNPENKKYVMRKAVNGKLDYYNNRVDNLVWATTEELKYRNENLNPFID